jgi:hypothetical protein
LQGASDDAARAIALKYRILSPYTNWIVVAERSVEDRLDAAPALRVVPQTLAAGWGGTGSTQKRVGPISASSIRPMFDASGESVLSSRIMPSAGSSLSQRISASMDSPTLWRDVRASAASRSAARNSDQKSTFDVAAFLSGDSDGSSRPRLLGGNRGSDTTGRPQFGPSSKIAALIRLIEEDHGWLDEGRAIELLREAGFDELMDEIFSMIGDAPLNPMLAIEAVLGVMLSDPVINTLPADLQGRARLSHHRGLQILQESMLTSTRAAKAFEFLIRLEPHNLFEPQIIDKARWALEPIADLRRVIEKIEARARNAAQDALKEGITKSAA